MREPVLAVEGNEFHALREDDLIVFIHKCRDIRPIEHRIVIHGVVYQTSRNFHIGLARMKGYADGP